ncbi:MAG: NlpC/P60 family protein, partial [Polaromonas sp.]
MRLHQYLAIATVVMLLSSCGTAPFFSSRGVFGQPVSRLTEEESNDIAIHAMGLVGTPYRYGGNTPDTGFDCSGLIGYVYRSRAGSAPPRTVAQLDGWGQPIAAQSLR